MSRTLLMRFGRAWRRRMARWGGRRLHARTNADPLISFTFDDFPVSAATEAGKILSRHGIAGTFYSAFGLMTQRAPTGQIFSADNLPQLFADGHEVGCHTFDHLPAGETDSREYEASIARNSSAFVPLSEGRVMQSHSYPISPPRPLTKRLAGGWFRACRGGGQSFNRATLDLNYLDAFFIERSDGDFGTIEAIIEQNASEGGWLIFATHDVTAHPTQYGCTPEIFEAVVKRAFESRATILPVSLALDRMGVPALARRDPLK